MQHVVERVGLLLRGERPARPVVLLPRLPRVHPDEGLQQLVEAERGDAEEARGEGGVEEGRHREGVQALEVREVIVGGVEHLDDAGIGQAGPQRGQVGEEQRVHQVPLARVGGDLNEAELARIVMQAVRLGVDGHGPRPRERGGETPHVLGGADPAGRVTHGRRGGGGTSRA